MADVGFFEGIVRDLTGRGMFGGKFQLRLFLQPILAMLLGLRLGVRDAKEGTAPLLIGLRAAKGNERWPIVRASLKSAIIPLTVALVVDGILQHMILGRIRPMAAVVVGALLVYLPFILVRGWAYRIWTSDRLRRRRHAS